MPKRIQRKRTKGWKMPPNTVYVGRPSKWGNPYKAGEKVELGDFIYYGIKELEQYENITPEHNLHAMQLFYFFTQVLKKYGKLDLSELKGKNLACWCPLDKPCHADILLKLANK